MLDVQPLLSRYLTEIRKLYGQHLKSLILYGSYARGDFTEDSDIDVMILTDLRDEEAECYRDALSELGFQYNVEYGIWIMPIVKNLEHFFHWVPAYPFYRNVWKEGVVLYETA